MFGCGVAPVGQERAERDFLWSMERALALLRDAGCTIRSARHSTGALTLERSALLEQALGHLEDLGRALRDASSA